jgi:hypothetical protein
MAEILSAFVPQVNTPYFHVRFYAGLSEFRRTLLIANVRNSTQGVVEAVGEISGADHKRKLNDLTFVVMFTQVLQGSSADR